MEVKGRVKPWGARIQVPRPPCALGPKGLLHCHLWHWVYSWLEPGVNSLLPSCLSQVRSLTRCWGCFGNEVLQTLLIALFQPK